ncbi:MAG: NCS2 family permease [Candidatus Obscuribacter sp.]|jgi:AGZA family xanthine/uracil permease-like MFS transporter|nr:NCS2 family permease [Candidatus Obscuribacter sp.]MBK9201627.1 NCS2 family permease [Candidatus Obscuribacter sp.]MBK9619927.1 NCS2 family permease [Candidatus Obscuribacter sp.]MBK9770615.1 NCS2 family permease [Candidatus Obscuribacter sp.]MDQ5968035.1 adenine/guanine/hypoxanthine permease [Cyanobacteriota bacterium erpe_2018_sw_39hr_WHONDRS-SW48-000098_B_bin.30]
MSLDSFFKLKERGTTIKIELLGGLTTFLTMAYIIVVNPAILSFAGIPQGPSTTATILSAVFGCLLMGLYANRPLAVAPYMGENAFIAFGLAALGIGWQQRLGAVFVSGVLFLLLALLRIRPWLANSISTSMKHSFAAGIGLFLALIGLYETGIIESAVQGMPAKALLLPDGITLGAPPVPLKLGNIHDVKVLIALAGTILTAILLSKRVKGAMLIGITLSALTGFALGVGEAPKGLFSVPFSGDLSLAPIFAQLDIASTLKLSFLPILLTLFLMSFLDTLSTLVGVGANCDMIDKNGNLIDVEKPMIVDAVTCMFSAVVGSSTSGAFIESAAGVREGARTGLATVVVALLFALSMFVIPLLEPLQHLKYAYGPALICVGLLMVGSVRQIDVEDATEAFPAFTTIAMMAFTYSIANGLTAGLVLYALMKILTGRVKELKPGGIILAVLCLVYFVFGLPH